MIRINWGEDVVSGVAMYLPLKPLLLNKHYPTYPIIGRVMAKTVGGLQRKRNRKTKTIRQVWVELEYVFLQMVALVDAI